MLQKPCKGVPLYAIEPLAIRYVPYMTRGRWFATADWAEAWARRDPLIAHLVAPLLATLRPLPGERILDIGTGAGQAAIAVASAVGPAGEAVGVDISPPVLDIAEAKAHEAGVANIEFVCLDASNVSIPGAPFDAITSLLGVMFFEDPVAAFTNLRQHVLAGGRIAFLAWASPGANPLLVENLLAPFLQDAGWSDADSHSGSFSLANPARVHEILASAGWTDITLRQQSLTPLVPAAAVFDDALLDVYAVPPTRRAEALGHVADQLARYRSGDDVEVPLAINLVTAYAPKNLATPRRFR